MTSPRDERRPRMLTGSELVIRRGYLRPEDFKKFLELVREIAIYDPERKLWVVSPRKVASLAREGRLESVLTELGKYADVDEEAVLRLAATERVRLTLKPLSLSFTVPPPRDVVERLSGYGDWRGSVFYLKSLTLLPQVVNLLSEAGIAVEGADSLDALLTARLRRADGRLYVHLEARDREVLRALSEACTLTYRIEKVILGADGSFEGTEIVERRIRAYRVLEGGRVLAAPVGLIDRIEEALTSLGFKVVRDFEPLPSFSLDLKPDYSLMPHQEEAFERWFRRKRGTIAIFTRGGKSFIALKAIEKLRKPTVIFVPTRELVITWLQYLEKYLGVPRTKVGVLGAGEVKLRDITVAIYNSGVKHADKLVGRFELAVFDEAHHVPAATFKEIALRIDSLYRMALSATPRRRDGNEELLYALCGDLVYNMGYRELLKLRIVAPIEIYDVKFVESEEEKLSTLVDILRRHKDAKTIVFTQYLETAKRVYSRLVREGFSAVLITGEVPASKRKLAFLQFQRGYVNVVVTTTVLDEGITVPDAEVAVIYEGSGEARQLIQRIGRVLGYAPGKTAKVYEIVNISSPREKSAYFRRKWVQSLYLFPELRKYVLEVKRESVESIDKYLDGEAG